MNGFSFLLGGVVMRGLLGAFEHIPRMLTGFVSVYEAVESRRQTTQKVIPGR